MDAALLLSLTKRRPQLLPPRTFSTTPPARTLHRYQSQGKALHTAVYRPYIMNQAEDVEIVLSHKRRYKFHSGTLARNSTWFADKLSESNAARLNHRAKSAGIKIRWMVHLVELPSQHNRAGVLELVVCNGLWSASATSRNSNANPQ